MPLFSDLTPLGLFEFSSDASEAEKIYRGLKAAYVDPATGQSTIDTSIGTYQEAKIYGWALALGDAKMLIRQAGRELVPETSYYQLASHEKRYHITPGPDDSVSDRRATLAARRKAARGPRYEAMYDALATLLGDGFLGYRPITIDEAVAFPEDIDEVAIMKRHELPARSIRMLKATARENLNVDIAYENWNPRGHEVLLQAGDQLVVDPGNWGLVERVEVVSATGTGTERSFNAVFTKPHSLGTYATTGNMPIWSNTKRHVLIIVTPEVAVDPVRRGKVNELLSRVMRAPTTWQIVQTTSEADLANLGPFKLGESPLGAVPIESMPSLLATSYPPAVPLTILPALGPLSGGTAVTITGSGFLAASGATIGGTALTSFLVVDDTTITGVTGVHVGPADNYDVTVLGPGGNGTIVDGFFYLDAAPELLSLDFDLADTLGGDTITITGTDLDSALSCTVGGTSATILSNTSTSLSFTMPAKAAGLHNVQVTTLGGPSNTLSIEAWNPGLIAGCTKFHERPDYDDVTAGWVARVGSAIPLVGGPPPDIAGEPDFNGSSNFMYLPNSGALFDRTAPTQAGTAIFIINADSVPAPAGLVYNEPGLIGEFGVGSVGMGVSTAGCRTFIHDGAWKSAVVPMTTGAYHTCIGRFSDATATVECQVDGKNAAGVAGFQSTPIGTISVFDTTCVIGTNLDIGALFDGKMRAFVTANQRISDSDADKTHRWGKCRHGSM